MLQLDTVGLYRKPQGLNGQIRIQSYTHPEEKIFDYQPWLLKDHGEVMVEEYKKIHDGFLVKLKDLPSWVNLYRNLEIQVKLPKIESDDEFYIKDLIGLNVFDIDNKYLGKVDSLTECASQILMITYRDKEVFYVPFRMDEVITKIDFKNKNLWISWHEADFFD